MCETLRDSGRRQGQGVPRDDDVMTARGVRPCTFGSQRSARGGAGSASGETEVRYQS